MAGDYEYYRHRYGPLDADVGIVAGVDPSAANIVACPTNHTVFIQRILGDITTDAATTLTFRDNAGTPVVIAVVKASIGVGALPNGGFDFGAVGIALTAGKGLDLVAGAAGYAGKFHIQGYKKLTTVVGDH